MAVGDVWPLASRDQELAAFARALDDPAGRSVVFYGPAGVGKSRLADACRDHAEAHGWSTARVVASASAASLPLGALAPVLPPDLGPAAGPTDLFERTRSELTGRGASRRFVLLVDDAHLLDTSSAVLLTQLVEAEAVFLVATIRDGEPLPDAVAGWWRQPGTTRIDVADLDRGATGELLALALDGAVGTDAVARLQQASGGNPLLLREMVRQAVDGGQLRVDSGTWRLTGEIPPSRRLADVLASRLEALDDRTRRILDVLAVCAPLGPAELGDDATLDELDALERAGLVRVDLDDRRHQVALAHPVYGEALRAGLTVLRRRSILLATAARLEALGTRRREDARRVAMWRLDAGGTPDPALLLQAARVARYSHDFHQVKRLATVLRSLDPSGESAVLLGEANYELGHFAESEAVLAAPVPHDTPDWVLVQRATLRTKNFQWGLCDWPAALQVVKDAQAAIGGAFADDLLAEEGAVLMFSGRPQDAIDVMAPITSTGPRTQILVALSLGPALANVGRTAEGIAASAEGFRIHTAVSEPLALAHPGTHIINQAYALVEAGRLAEAEELATLGYEVAVDDNIPVAQIWFTLMLAKAATLRGRIQVAQRWYQEGCSTARLHGFQGPLRLALAGQATADAALGDAAGARAAVAEMANLPPFAFLHHDQALGPAWAAWADGRHEQARLLLTAEAEVATQTHNRGVAAWLWHDAARLGVTGLADRLLGLAATSDSPLVAARAAHVAALDGGDAEALAAASVQLEALGLLLTAAEAAWSASDAHRRAGDQRAAAAQVRRAEALAAQCPGARTPGLFRADVAVPLTRREREVAALAGQGLTSQDIAERLFLSVRTVDNHLQHVYAKLGVNRRDQLADALGS